MTVSGKTFKKVPPRKKPSPHSPAAPPSAMMRDEERSQSLSKVSGQPKMFPEVSIRGRAFQPGKQEEAPPRGANPRTLLSRQPSSPRPFPVEPERGPRTGTGKGHARPPSCPILLVPKRSDDGACPGYRARFSFFIQLKAVWSEMPRACAMPFLPVTLPFLCR